MGKTILPPATVAVARANLLTAITVKEIDTPSRRHATEQADQESLGMAGTIVPIAAKVDRTHLLVGSLTLQITESRDA